MDLIDSLKENNLIICPSDYKKSILLDLNKSKKILDVSFLSLNEYINNYLFTYDNKAILYLVNKYKLSVKNAKEILDNLIYVKDKEYGNLKLDNLVKYKKELDENNLLIYNPIFKSYISNKNIIIYGYGDLDNYTLSLFDNPTVLKDEIINKEYKIYEFNMIEEEVEYLYSSIFDLLNKGIDINKIFILNYSNDYKAYFKRFNTYFDFKIEAENDESILGTSIVKEFIEDIGSLDRQDIYNKLVNYNNEIANKLINILNNYAGFDLKEVKELIIEDLSNTSIKDNKSNIVRCIDEKSIIHDDEYVFLIGFNDNYPKSKKDIEYITDNLKEKLGLPLIEEENKLNKENVKIFLSNINNLYLSYSKNSPFNIYNGQYLLKTKPDKYKLSNAYSEYINRLKYAYKLDDLNKYGLKDKSLNNLYLNYDKNDYLEYDNKFNKLDDKEIKSIDHIKLSYSSMDDYYKCSFRYYLKHILKISEFEGNFNTWIGNVFHGVLEDFFSKDSFDFEESFNRHLNDEINKNEAFKKEYEKYFIDKLKDELKKDIEILKTQRSNSLLNKVKCEYENNLKIDEHTDFTGRIDKVVYKEGEEPLAMVVDYKTGTSSNINLKLTEFGLSLQLPTYLYLLRNDEKFKDYNFTGFYLQHLLSTIYKFDEKKDIDTQRNELLKLDGYSNSNPDITSVSDTTLAPGNKSESIRSFTLKKDGGVYSKSRVLSSEDMDSLIKLVQDKIEEASTSILSGKFDINPKVINGNNKSCEHCDYKEVCFKRYENNVYYNIEDDKDEE